MKNVIFLFSYLVFMGLSSCSYPKYRLQHEQADDVYWNSSDNQEKSKTLDDVKFDRPAAPATPKAPKQPKQPKQLQESSTDDEAVGVDPNEDARAEAAYQAWNQQRIAGNQQTSNNANQNQELPAQTYTTTNPNTVNNYTNYNYYSGYNGYNRHGLRYRSRWYAQPNFFNNTPYWGWNNFSGWQFSYNCPSFYQPWVNPYCGPTFGPNWGYNPYCYPNYYGNFNFGYGFGNGYFNNWYNPYYPYNYRYYSPWAGGYYRPGGPVHEKNTNPSRSRPRESIGNAGKDHNDQSPGMINPGNPFFGKKANNEGVENGTGKIGQPNISNTQPSRVPPVSSPIQNKPTAPNNNPAHQNIEPINPVANPIVPVQNPVSASPNQNREKSFRYETIGADDGKLIQGNNGPVYVPPRDHAQQVPAMQPSYPQNNANNRNQGYIPDRSQNIQQIQAPPSNRNDFNSNSRVQERIEYQAPAPQRNQGSGGFGGFSNGSGGGGSNNSGNKSGGSISRPR